MVQGRSHGPFRTDRRNVRGHERQSRTLRRANMKPLLRTKLAALVLALSIASPGLAGDYASKNGWRFLTFSDAPFPWDVYRGTFIGIPPAEDRWSSAFDWLFYEQVSKSQLSADGNCFGIS